MPRFSSALLMRATFLAGAVEVDDEFLEEAPGKLDSARP